MIETHCLRSERSAKTTVCSLSRPESIPGAQLASISMAHASNAILIEGGKSSPCAETGLPRHTNVSTPAVIHK
jgi:hypothetical protein